jgi:hypothetical protein
VRLGSVVEFKRKASPFSAFAKGEEDRRAVASKFG